MQTASIVAQHRKSCLSDRIIGLSVKTGWQNSNLKKILINLKLSLNMAWYCTCSVVVQVTQQVQCQFTETSYPFEIICAFHNVCIAN